MRYLSVCSGIEAATQAWHPLGWTPVAFSEIEPFPCAVLQHHYPQVPNWGDMTKFEEWPDAAIDVLCGGTPCQDYSVAGQRLGMAGARGQLTLTFVEIAARYRPDWLVWENVPGVLSSNGGRDFARFLGDLSGTVIEVPAGGWSNSGIIAGIGDAYGIAYRVLDAQHTRTRRFPFAVPQRRRRVWVVGYLGDWRRAAAVFFDRESLSGHPAPRREAGKIAPTIPARSLGGGGLGTDFDCDGGLISAWPATVAPTLDSHFGDKMGLENQHINGGCGLFVAHTLRGDGFDASEDGTGRGTPIVPVAIQESASRENPNAGPGGAGFKQDGSSYTLEAQAVPQAVAFDCKGTQVQFADDGSHPTLRSMGHNNSHQNGGGHAAVAFDLAQITSAVNRSIPQPVSPTMAKASNLHAFTPWAVRRLTPIECERLQGFPDDFTNIPWRNKPTAPDGPRYKSLGNSWAVNCAEWIGERIAMVAALEAAA
ncbi:DNA cytosine methyltransferase [Paracoccus sp. CPCC 101403]|uniref:DNA (cytosine-5-)-methyltransferase n=1 Tax=Paracoccus broussonetiae TaxID=3075834 RepID=A0ABU3EAD5_9RHOB|nr:DNA cytosine methyltransferase [Paracoccus sp. CPCC 101403]MDT1061181.1 DNA cytosine methyltransferase [Paracoccus sp. CPCC 101403]